MQLRRSEEHRYHLEVTEAELNAIHAGLAETLEALEDWEFHTRTGFQREEMKRVLIDLREARQSLSDGAD